MTVRAEIQITGFIIRFWNDGSGYPAPYDYQVTGVSSTPEHVVMLGLKTDGEFGPEHYEVGFGEIAKLGFKTAEYERIGKNMKSRSVFVDISDPTKGVKLMHKIPHASAGTVNGAVDPEVVEANVAKAIENRKAGHLTYKAFHQEDHGDGEVTYHLRVKHAPEATA